MQVCSSFILLYLVRDLGNALSCKNIFHGMSLLHWCAGIHTCVNLHALVHLCPQCLIIGGGPCGLRAAIELALLGAKVVVIEKRDTFSRNNVLHLWPFTIQDLRNLGAKKFYGKFCAGAIDHISKCKAFNLFSLYIKSTHFWIYFGSVVFFFLEVTVSLLVFLFIHWWSCLFCIPASLWSGIRQLQLILLKVSLIMGVEVHVKVEFLNLLEPPEEQDGEQIITFLLYFLNLFTLHSVSFSVHHMFLMSSHLQALLSVVSIAL